jgi:hypothetical protein
MATILLAYALGQMINAPGKLLPIRLIGIFIPIQINLNTAVSLVVMGMMATGIDWLLRDHPQLGDKSTLPHWLLPSLTAWIIHIALSNLPVSPVWWIAFASGGLILLLVLLAEYIVIDPQDIRQPLASAGLNALAYALFLILAVSLHSIGMRVVMLVPALSLAAGFITLRVLQLNRPTIEWSLIEALVSVVVIAQVSTALHYLPISPMSFGLTLLGLIYALINFELNLKEDMPLRQAVQVPLVVLALLWLLALLMI